MKDVLIARVVKLRLGGHERDVLQGALLGEVNQNEELQTDLSRLEWLGQSSQMFFVPVPPKQTQKTWFTRTAFSLKFAMKLSRVSLLLASVCESTEKAVCLIPCYCLAVQGVSYNVHNTSLAQMAEV